jgi:23S rRNA (cytosine1962-C5)-methyltransferase
MKAILLKRGREKSLLRKHPWIFSGAIAKIEGHPKLGETVDILAAEGALLARGAYSPQSQIAVRVWTFDPREEVSPDFFVDRLRRAVEARRLIPGEGEPAGIRLVNSESDGLPGIVVDRYGDFLVAQFLSAGAEHWKGVVVETLVRLVPVSGVYERSDADVREKEGLPRLAGVLTGAEPPDLVEIREGPCRFLVDVKRGHKTGFYLDQRENRRMMAEFAGGADVLNGFSYTGGFGVAALLAGAARVTNVDSSRSALELGSRNAEINGLDAARIENVEGDVFTVLRRWRDAGREFDLIVLDPPKFAESQSQLARASRGYKDINLLAFKLLRPGGVLFTFSCSALMSPELFQKIVADAALDAGREAQIIRRLAQAADHPTLLSFPEGSYLKGFVIRTAAEQ